MTTLKIILIIIHIILIIILLLIYCKNQKKYKDIDKITKYFEDNKITTLRKGVKEKDLPEYMINNKSLETLINNGTIILKKEKYYLPKKKEK